MSTPACAGWAYPVTLPPCYLIPSLVFLPFFPPHLQAVEFVQLQRDDDLWEQLIALTLGDAQLTGGPHSRSLSCAFASALGAHRVVVLIWVLCIFGCCALFGANHWSPSNDCRLSASSTVPCVQAPCWTMQVATSTLCKWSYAYSSCPPCLHALPCLQAPCWTMQAATLTR